MSDDNKNIEVSQYRDNLARNREPFDKLTAEDLLAEIAINETLEYCEAGKMGGTAQHQCMEREQSRFQKDPKAFVENFLRSKNDGSRSVYKKMSERYLGAAQSYLNSQIYQNRNRYYEEIFHIQKNLKWCLDLVSVSEYQKLSTVDLSALLRQTQCVDQVETTQKTREQERDEALQRSEELWKAAEAMREASRGWSAGDPDDIQKIMNRYAAYRYYQGFADDFKNAQVRLQKSKEMVGAIGRERGGWPQFKKKFCGEPERIASRDCPKGFGVGITKYRRSCEFGLSEEYEVQSCQSFSGGGKW